MQFTSTYGFAMFSIVSRCSHFLEHNMSSLAEILAKRLEGITLDGMPIFNGNRIGHVSFTVSIPHRVARRPVGPSRKVQV